MIEVYRGSINTWECDEMGHMNVRFYVAKSMEGLAEFAHAVGLEHAFRGHLVDLVAAGHDEVEHQKRDSKRKDAVAERLESPGAHGDDATAGCRTRRRCEPSVRSGACRSRCGSDQARSGA